MDNHPISCQSLSKFFHVDGKQLEHQYVAHLSNFLSWEQREHATDWILFEDNIGPHLSIDETALSQGELYTVITSKAAKGKKGVLVAMIKGTDSDRISLILKKIPINIRHKVKEVTLDMAASMERIVKYNFPKAKRVTDRFHVQKLASEAVQEMRIKYRWEALDQENNLIDACKEIGKKYVAEKDLKMGIRSSNSWHEAAICCSKAETNGHLHSTIVQKYYFVSIHYLNKPIIFIDL